MSSKAIQETEFIGCPYKDDLDRIVFNMLIEPSSEKDDKTDDCVNIENHISPLTKVINK